MSIDNKSINNSNWLEGVSSNVSTKQATEFKTPKLTRKQALFVKQMIDNPKQSATEAVRQVYNTKTNGSARAVASENLTKPNIIMALEEHANLFESVIVGTVRDWGNAEGTRKREIALDAAKFGHDKIFGKATVKIQQSTSVVQIAINLTGDGEQPPASLLD